MKAKKRARNAKPAPKNRTRTPKVKRGTVPVQLSREQAAAVACWLADDYKPGEPPPLSDADWSTQQRATANKLSRILEKAARRKRSTETLNLAIPRTLARWFGAFMRSEGTWDFGIGNRHLYVQAQWSPEPIQKIAALFFRAACRQRGKTRNPTLDQVEKNITRHAGNPDHDERWLRRLKAKNSDLQFARDETLKVGRD